MNTISNSKYEAAETGSDYFRAAYDQLEMAYSGASEGEKATAASTLALAMAISELTTAVTGAVDGSPVAELIGKVLEGRR